MLIAPFAGLFDLYAINPRCHSSPPLAFFTEAEEHRALAYVGAPNQTKHHSDSLSEIWTASAFGSHFHGAGMTPPCANRTSPSVKAPNALRNAHLNGMPCQFIPPTAVGASARAYQLPRLHILPHFVQRATQFAYLSLGCSVGTQRSTVNLWSGRRCVFFSNPQLHGTGSFLVLSFDGTAFVHTVKLALIYFVHTPLSQITRDGGWLTSLISTQIHPKLDGL
ncbi:hypothetical protein B0H13DRAFT_2151748, partial [Mycena leptocephala]